MNSIIIGGNVLYCIIPPYNTTLGKRISLHCKSKEFSNGNIGTFRNISAFIQGFVLILNKEHLTRL